MARRILTGSGTFATVGLLAAAPGKPTFASPLRDPGTAAWTRTFRSALFGAAHLSKLPLLAAAGEYFSDASTLTLPTVAFRVVQVR